MRIQWQIEKGVRCDLVAYASVNLSGKRSPVRIFPGGGRQGDVDGSDLRSMVIRAPAGTRVLLIGAPGPDWEAGPWRCVRIVESVAMAAPKPSSLPGVRIPDLDLLDEVDAKRTATDLQASYPLVGTLAQGQGWTFGQGASLKGRVRLVRVEKDRPAEATDLTAAERVLRVVLDEVRTRHPGALDDVARVAVQALRTELAVDGRVDADERARGLAQWVADDA